MSGLPPRSSVKRWLVTTNHKDIGILYIATSIFFLVFAGVLAMLIRLQMLSSGGTILDGGGYNQVVTAHGLLMVFWFLSPFAFGFANYIVPLQIGADDLAFPRLNAMSYWLYVFSGLAMAASFFQGTTFDGGWTMYAPLNVPTYMGAAEIGQTTAVIGLALFVTSVTLGSVNFLTTIYRMRAEGLRMRDIPVFSISILLTVWMMLFAFAALLAALVILGADHLLQTRYFTSTEGGSMLWAHLFWFFGHPEVYIVFFPALGALAEMVQTFSGRRLVGRKWFVIAMALVAIQSFIVWMHHMFLTSINLPIKTVIMVTTIGISLPFDLMVFSLIYTMIKGRVRWTTPFLFSIGALVIFIIGGITGVFLGAIVLDYQFRGTYWVVAHFHYVMASSAVILIGAMYYWYPKITGKMYNQALGKAHFWFAFIGFNMLYFPMFVVWETPRRVFDYGVSSFWHQLASFGGFLFAASFLIMFYNLYASLYSDRDVGDSPWAYTASSEWAVSSPPPLENFPGNPSFTSGKLEFLGSAEADGGSTETATDGGVAHAEQHADHASWWPMLISASALIVAIGLGGVAPSFVAWPFIFALPFFVAFLGIEGARQSGWNLVHKLYGVFAVLLLGGVFAVFNIHHGIDGFTAVNPSFYVVFGGAIAGSYTLIGMGYESFYVPEPELSEQWPFESVSNMKLGMWTFLGSDIILFGALIGSYVFIRFQAGWEEWWHHTATLTESSHQVLPGLINTYLLLASSFTVVLALAYARRGNKRLTVGFMVATFVGGGLFLINKAYEWVHFYSDPVTESGGTWTLTSDIASSTFYLTTGLHAAHVIVGMLIMLFLIARTWDGAYWEEDESADTIEYFGLYWHFVDIVWLFLFPLFYVL